MAFRSAKDAPQYGKEFLGLLSCRRFTVMSAPNEAHDFWQTENNVCVPFRPKEGFFHLVGWCELPDGKIYLKKLQGEYFNHG